MKVLCLFADMLRASSLSSFCSTNVADTSIDVWLKKLGGTAYVNSYTPAPDTPRSLACFYSGYNPKSNGCDTRIKWPYYFLKNKSNLFDFLDQKAYEVVTNFSRQRLNVGILPPNANPLVNFHTLHELLDNKLEYAQINNLFMFIDLDDYHKAVDDYSGLSFANNYGIEKLSSSLNKIGDQIFDLDFDHIFLFSDHGCMLSGDKFTQKHLEFLANDRSKIVMFHHAKWDNGLNKDFRLCSIVDFFPSFYRLISNVTPPIQYDGLTTLFDRGAKGLSCIVIEDHVSLTSSFYIMPDRWAIRTKDYFAFVNSYDIIAHTIDGYGNPLGILHLDPAERDIICSTISNESTNYANANKLNNIMLEYSKLKATREPYSDGSNRHSRLFVRLSKFLYRLSKLRRSLVSHFKK